MLFFQNLWKMSLNTSLAKEEAERPSSLNFKPYKFLIFDPVLRDHLSPSGSRSTDTIQSGSLHAKQW
jgi:hypothetical protein